MISPERGSLAGASAGVLDGLARALRLDDAERAHLVTLAHEANGSNAVLRPRHRPSVRPGLQWALDAIASPAIVVNNHSDILAANHLGRALYVDIFSGNSTFARFIFLDAAARRLFPDWAAAADMTAANLRISAGRDPGNAGIRDLVSHLSAASGEFRRRWESHDVRPHAGGVNLFHHHVVGDLTLAWESLDLRSEPGLMLTIYTAEPGSPSAEALALLASWSSIAPADGTASFGG